MNNQNTPSGPRITILTLLGMVSILLFVAAACFHSRTIGFPTLTASAGCIAIAALLSLPLSGIMRRVTRLRSTLMATLASFILSAALLAFSLMLANHLYSARGPVSEARAEVVALERVKRSNTRRVGRRYIADGTYHYEYRVRLAVPVDTLTDTLTFTVPYSHYARLRRGQHIPVHIRRGLSRSRTVSLP
ncbi:MAG: hypothetical protein K2M19_04175 [Muribaculaceae bacterium]|nr:hypothetical protein [Muribaculaceae bacterium]